MATDSICPLVNYAATINANELPYDVLKYTKNLFMDTIGCILGAKDLIPSHFQGFFPGQFQELSSNH
ncbi:MAG: MmgE/PrpD family protein [Desulfotignum sp.]|nr:MmgE/PrpD family protein [Desulfotignum sp.]